MLQRIAAFHSVCHMHLVPFKATFIFSKIVYNVTNRYGQSEFARSYSVICIDFERTNETHVVEDEVLKNLLQSTRSKKRLDKGRYTLDLSKDRSRVYRPLLSLLFDLVDCSKFFKTSSSTTCVSLVRSKSSKSEMTPKRLSNLLVTL